MEAIKMNDTVNACLARFICDFDERELPAATRTYAVSAILDTLAVTIAGSAEDAIRLLGESLPVSQEAAAWAPPWSVKKYRADDAAILFGTASHMLDYDDVSMVTVCHPSAPVLSAMVAAIGAGAVKTAPTGRAFITAFCIGTEVLIRVGQAMGFRHYELGFHATATLGHLGAAAALARLMGLNRTQTAHALSIAASMSSGLRTNFGSMVKPLHVGLAAANALRAVQLAQGGIEGAADVFEAGGFLHAFSGGATDTWPAEVAFGAPFVLQDPGFEQKRYPCCYMLHKIIEASLALRREHGISLDQVQSVMVRMAPGGTRPLNHPYPRSGLNGKFSAPYAVVASILDGRINLASFLDAAVLRPEVQARLHDVTVIEEGVASNEGSDLGNAPVSVELILHDGRMLSKTITPSPGSQGDPITVAQLQEKWTDCFSRGMPRLASADARVMFEQGLHLDETASSADWLAGLFGK
ncbi:MAG: MmgE/PrpD family protein [Pseudomonadota bacterium]